MTAKLYAWLDLETTGSDERVDAILEVGVSLCADNFVPIASKDWVIGTKQHARDAAPIRVREMHHANGLWVEAMMSTLTIAEADRQIHEWLSLQTGGQRPQRQLILAGSGVGHFDSRFIRAYLPLLERWLTFWTMDVGVIRRFLPLCGMEIAETETNKPHRALADALYHMDEMRLYREMVANPAPPEMDDGIRALIGDDMPPLMGGRAGDESRGPVGF